MSFICFESPKNSDRLRIVISMHPLDRLLYSEQLIESIIAHHDCTVYCSQFPADDSNIDLTNIDLVIIGVTEKYITWSNSGFICEALTAVKKHVPILPIMLESGIANLFNTRVGKFHYIESIGDSFSDETLLQINNHISTLCDDAKSSNEAKTKVFISYRKQDVVELNRLIKIINSYPERDKISLWYDTNLNPGDNYQITIMEQLKSSSLFILLVTPSLLESKNYVMRIEYPLAVEENKRIIPVIMQKTDLKKLYELFPKLPKCITDTQIRSIFSKL